MSLQYLAIKTTFSSLEDEEKKLLLGDLFNEKVIYCREILNEKDLMAYMIINCPENPIVRYYEYGSDEYLQITQWCKIDRDLFVYKGYNQKIEKCGKYGNRILTTPNGILYDIKTEKFSQLNYDIFKYLKINYPKFLIDFIKHLEPKLLCREDILISKEEIKETKEHLEKLQEIGSIGERISISSFFL